MKNSKTIVRVVAILIAVTILCAGFPPAFLMSVDSVKEAVSANADADFLGDRQAEEAAFASVLPCLLLHVLVVAFLISAAISINGVTKGRAQLLGIGSLGGISQVILPFFGPGVVLIFVTSVAFSSREFKMSEGE